MNSPSAARGTNGVTGLGAIFFLSGVSALIYETVWVRMLTRVVGTTHHATSAVLASFMAGLALGSLLTTSWSDRLRRPLRVYAWLESLLAGAAMLVSFGTYRLTNQLVISLLRETAGDGASAMIVRWFGGAMLLLVPTTIMGMTLPVLTAFVARRERSYQSSLGFLYSVNTLGAVVGTLGCGFVLLGLWGERRSLWFAAALNATAAVLAFLLERHLAICSNQSQASECEVTMPLDEPPYEPRVRRWALVAIAISGFTALAYELVWTRLLLLYLGTSVYAFSGMLALLLFGIACGSAIGRRLAFSRRRPVVAFALIEMFIGLWGGIGLVVFPLFDVPMHPSLAGLMRMLPAIVMVFPAAVAFGWQFPVAARCAMRGRETIGRDTGRIYAVNTLGGIAGCIVGGHVLTPVFGSANTVVIVLAGLNVVVAGRLLCEAPPSERGRSPIALAACCAVYISLVGLVGNPYRKLIERRAVRELDSEVQIYSFDEGTAATTVAYGTGDRPDQKFLMVNGWGVTRPLSECKVMAHLPLALVESPRDMLVICFGMGTTLRSASRHPELERLDVVEIVPHVFDCFGYFHDDAEQIFAQPNVRRIVGDGRNHLMVTPHRYDVITLDPSPPLHSAGTANLYSREFFQLCRERLTDGGLTCAWLPAGPRSELMMILRAFHEAFPDGTLWGARENYGFFLVGGRQPIDTSALNLNRVAEKLSSRWRDDLTEWTRGYAAPDAAAAMFLLGPAGLATLTRGVRAVSDDTPYTEFPLWRWIRPEDPLTDDHIRREYADFVSGKSPLARPDVPGRPH